MINQEQCCEQQAWQKDVFVTGVPAAYNRPAAAKKITKAAQQCIPAENAEEGKREILPQRQCECSGNKA